MARTAEDILDEFDNPASAEVAIPEVAGQTSSTRERLVLEVLLDMREYLTELIDAIGECKEELVEIKELL